MKCVAYFQGMKRASTISTNAEETNTSSPIDLNMLLKKKDTNNECISLIESIIGIMDSSHNDITDNDTGNGLVW